MADEANKPNTPDESLINTITNTINGIYRRTRFTEPDANSEVNQLNKKINSSMENILSNVSSTTGLNNISSLYSKLLSLQNDKKTVDGFEDFFRDVQTDGALYGSFFNNRNLKQLDQEIDMICKYMPKLEETINIKVDNILSSDHFSRDYIRTAESGNSTITDTDEEFFSNFNLLKDKYNLMQFTEENLYEVLKYGETFVYCVPYKQAIERLLRGTNRIRTTESTKTEISFSESTMIEPGPRQVNYNDTKNKLGKFELEFNMSGTLTKEVTDIKNAYDRLKSIKEFSINLEAVNDIDANDRENKKISSGITPSSTLDTTDFFNTSEDGFVNTEVKRNTTTLKINGCLVTKLVRHNIIPIYVDEICLGYYYIENLDLFERSGGDTPLTDTTTPLNTLGVARNTETSMVKNASKIDDTVITQIANRLSASIDAKFINLHKNFTKEIYAILKASDISIDKANRFRVTFLPPDDVIHCYFRRDPISHRGISSLQKALIPAKMWVGIQMANTLAIMSRSQDRRVYYVKNSGIDTNISQILMNTMKQIKMNNFNIRQLENMKNVLNILGKFNDFVIPLGPSGDAPVQFEIMQGQQIDPQTDLLQSLEEQAVNSTDVPLELIQSRMSVDYAIQASMSSSRFLKHVYNWQAIVNRWHSNIVTLIYRAEFLDPTAVIKMELPVPNVLNFTNTAQFLDNANNMAMTVSEITGNGMTDIEKQEYQFNLRAEYAKPYIDMDLVQRVKDKTRLENKLNSTDAGGDDSGY